MKLCLFLSKLDSWLVEVPNFRPKLPLAIGISFIGWERIADTLSPGIPRVHKCQKHTLALTHTYKPTASREKPNCPRHSGQETMHSSSSLSLPWTIGRRSFDTFVSGDKLPSLTKGFIIAYSQSALQCWLLKTCLASLPPLEMLIVNLLFSLAGRMNNPWQRHWASN